MPEFLTLLTPIEALAKLLDNLPIHSKAEEIETVNASGRVTTAPIISPHALPTFDRSTVDGYAVRASDTHGASETLPAYLVEIGEIPMGAAPSFSLTSGQCATIHTGGMLPEGANAVVMVEHTQIARIGEIEVLRAVAVGENVLKKGEDIYAGETVIPAGTRLGPAEIGGLMALGLTRLNVARKPTVGIISSGDEVVPPEVDVEPGRVRDINSYTLSALVQACGGEAVRYGIVADRAESIKVVAQKALSECDTVVITAGSSASVRDLTAEVINQLGTPGVLVHGVNVRPGKPTILGVCDGRAVIGLPGNPVSALVIAGLFVVPVVEALLGLVRHRPKSTIQGRLATNLASQAGREDWIPVRVSIEKEGYLVDPVFGKSNFIFNLVQADGLLRIPPDATGLSAGESVEIHLF